jgi:hypothetical protein
MRELFRAWTKAVETFVLEVMLDQRRGKRAALMRGSLFFLSRIFALAVKARRALYHVHILRDRHR